MIDDTENEINVPSVGNRFRVRVVQKKVPVPLAQYTGGRWIIFRSPSGVSTQKVATIETSPGTDGWLNYVREAGLITETGEWKLRTRVMVDAAHDLYGKWRPFKVVL